LLAGVVKLETAEPAMVKLSSCHALEEVKDAFSHAINSVAALKNCKIYGMTLGALDVVRIAKVEGTAPCA
jgi:hypothetical protein